MATRRITVVRPSDVFRMFEDSMSSFMNDIGASNSNGLMSVEVNVKELDDRYEITAPVPGFNKDDINISFEDSMLVIEGAMKEENKKTEGNYVMQEYKEGNFKRAVTLPGKVDSEKADAELVNGVLTVKVPKMPEVMPKKVKIKAS